MMKENLIQVICGPGKGKTASALGRGVTALLKGKTVIMVQFLKGSMETEGMEIVKWFEFRKKGTGYRRVRYPDPG